MAFKHIVLIVVILLTAVLVVGLILCRPMGGANYAGGTFSFDAVTEIFVWAYEEQGDGADIQALPVTGSRAMKNIISFFDGRGFGRTPGSLFSHTAPTAQPGDRCWGVTFKCAATGSALTVEYTGGTLRLIGAEPVRVTTQDKDEWAEEVYELLIPLYPEPEPEPTEPEATEAA